MQAPLKRAAEVPVADKGYAELGMIPAKPQKMVLLVHGGPKVVGAPKPLTFILSFAVARHLWIFADECLADEQRIRRHAGN